MTDLPAILSFGLAEGVGEHESADPMGWPCKPPTEPRVNPTDSAKPGRA